jgi:hypothetical protein
MIQTRPTRGGFLRAFGCAQFIIPFLKGEGPYGSALIDSKRGAPQADIIREYKEALRRELAGDMVAKEVERRVEAGQTPMTDEEEDILLDYFIERLPLRSTKMRYHSFLVYFGMLKRLGWVEPTGEEEFSEAQETMSAGPKKAPARGPAPAPSPRRATPREAGQPRIYYRITAAGRRASEDLIADPIQALYNYPKEKRSARPKRFPMRRPKRTLSPKAKAKS